MAVAVVDLSRRGDQGSPLSELAAELDWQLSSWIQAANAQNPQQQLTLLTNSQQAAGLLGWTLRCRLAALHNGAAVELMSQWVLNLATAAVSCQVGLASGHDPSGGLGAHGLLSGGRGTTTSQVSVTAPFPLPAVIASSLDPGQEFFVFAFSQHTFSTRQAIPLLIAKDVLSGQWHLGLTDMAGMTAAAAWDSSHSRLLLAAGFRLEAVAQTPHTVLSRPAQWSPITPGIVWQDPLPPVQWLNPVVLPDALAVYGRSFGHLSYARASDGSGWLVLGPSPLAVRIEEPRAADLP
jgi:hypothetical protein